MNIKRALRIAQAQPWFKAFNKHILEYYGETKTFFSANWENLTPQMFISRAFTWANTEEGDEYWLKICREFDMKYYDDSIKVFVREAYGKRPVAKLIDAAVDDEPRFISALKDTGICYDSIESAGRNLVAYKNSYKIVEEWI